MNETPEQPSPLGNEEPSAASAEPSTQPTADPSVPTEGPAVTPAAPAADVPHNLLPAARQTPAAQTPAAQTPMAPAQTHVPAQPQAPVANGTAQPQQPAQPGAPLAQQIPARHPYPAAPGQPQPATQPHATQPHATQQHPQGAPQHTGGFGPPTGQPGNAFGIAAPGETVPLPEYRYAAPPKQKKPRQERSGKSRAGMITAGIAAAALLGGAGGAGVTAAILGNQTSVAQPSSQDGKVTITNPENTTAVSAIAQKAMPSVVTIEVQTGQAAGTGSGVIISEDGYILTNSHVVTLDATPRDQVSVRVFLSDGRILTGKIVGADPYSDLAVVKVEGKDLQAIEMADSSALGVGDLTVAIGAPLNLSSTVTSGVISALNRGITVGSTAVPEDPQQEQDQPSDPRDLWNFDFDRGPEGEQPQQQQRASGTVTLPVIQTDASINPGNSGGALLDGEGRLIGINVAIASTSASGDTAGSVGLGFAIPVNLAQRVAESLIAGEAPSHGLLGVTVGDASGDVKANQSGALLGELTRGGAADKAGLRSGDVVTAFNGIPVVDGTSLSALVRSVEGGSTVELTYLRDGSQKTTEVTLGTLET